ncbi:MAG: hypothetical protein WKG01_01430 [Kofleriaceae bacterium]
MTRRYVVPAATGAGLLGITVAIGWVLAANRPPGPYARPAPPAAVGAFREGGTPDRDVAIEAALGRLPGTIPAPDDAAFARSGLAPAWRALVRELARWPHLTSTDRQLDARSTELRARAATVSDQLAAARLGYYLDVQIPIVDSIARPELHAYRIDEVAFVRADRERVRVLGVRRLDHVRLAMLGRTSESSTIRSCCSTRSITEWPSRSSPCSRATRSRSATTRGRDRRAAARSLRSPARRSGASCTPRSVATRPPIQARAAAGWWSPRSATTRRST